MPVPSFSIQYGGEQSPGAKSAEDNLEENMLVQQVEGGNLSMDILDKELSSLESDQVGKVPNDQLEENCSEANLKEFNCGLERPRHQLSNGIIFIGNPSLRVDSSQNYQVDEEIRNKNEENARFLKTDSPQMVVCNILNGHSEPKAPLSEQASCKETTEHFSNSEENAFPCLECNKKGSSPEHDTTYGLSEDVLPGKYCHIDGLTEGENAKDASNSGISLVNYTPDSQGEGKEEAGTLTKQSGHTFGTNFEQHIFSRQDQKNEQVSSSGNSQQILTYRGVHDCNEDKESGPLGTEYLEDHTVALWVKWRGKWQTGFQCPRIDCPLPTLRAKPTHERKKYIAIFFPRTRRYSWADVLLVRPINEFPEPLASGTHRKWRKLVKDLTIPHRFIMQKLAVAMLNISDQLHTESVTENARKATTWKEFAMEASCCRDYSDLGRMLLKLQTMILPTYVSSDWLENSLSSWIHRCQSVQTADYVEILTEELVASMQWDKVSELWNSPVQPELGPEWKSWKQEAMKWFSTSHPVASVADIEQGNCDTSTGMESQISRKRLKLEVRRTENCASQMKISDYRILSPINQLDTDSGHSNFQENLGSRHEPHKEVLPKSAAAVDSATVDTRWNDISARSEDLKSIQSTIAVPADGNTVMVAMASTPYQYRQCSAYIAIKGRQCGRWASDGEAYCCVHLNSHSGGKLHLEEQRPPPDSPMCEGMTIHGDKCKHRARLGSLFCKKHRLQRNNDSNKMNNLLAPFGNNTKRKICDNVAIEKFSSLNASNGEEFGLVREREICTKEMLIPVVVGVTLDERNCLMNESELCSAVPPPVRAPSQGLPRCIGYYGQNNGEPCPDDAKKHTLYCEKHLPRFLKRARNGRSRLVSKDVFLHLLRTCCSRKQKLYLHQACELLYGFMKSSLSRQKPVSKDDIMDWILSEASKDVNVGEYLLKLVSSEREKITKLWSFATTVDKQSYTTETKMPPSTLQRHGKDQDSEEIVKCKICAGEFPDDQTMGVHWREVHKKEARWLFRGYACAVCMSSFTNRKVLEAHVKERHGVQFLEHSLLFRCMSCNSHCVNSEQLWQHVLSFHLKEFRMPDQSPDNCRTLDQLDQVSQQAPASGNSLCQNNGKSEQEGGSHRYICRFCGLKFDLLPDLGRHHQVAHMNPSSISQFLPKRRNHYVKHNRPCHPRFKKTFGAAYRFKKQSTFGPHKQFPTP
ncbi:histone-lysine N-methyltransferase SUVR5 [Iris pallida]|uniref:Histone-lysine N-methyltransferase SUVR5 n=1 Tax=Iris pallida TaxID=29817 RepID=A0AAX6GEK8_IRIPA|nr:histone-lysine N-methyltransferase SUVR5 [Iris pallida]